MPTPRGDLRRQQIVEAALAEIRTEAVADVQLAAIAERAGMKASHVLYYFGSRDDVLIAAVAHAEQQLAADRAERLRAIDDPMERLAAFVDMYLPDDRHDPVWKLWIEGWARSASRGEFGEVGSEAHERWSADLAEALEYAGASLPDGVATVTRRLIMLLDGIAIHVLAGHVTPDEAAAIAIGSIRSELRHQ